MSNTVFTIVSNNYFARALALVSSIKKFHPELKIYIALADNKSDLIPYESDDYEMIYLNDFPCSKLEEMKFKYDIVEFNTSIKPFVIEHLFHKGYEKVIYLDPDIYVYNSLEKIFALLDTYSIVLTPHRNCANMQEGEACIIEAEISTAGVFNLGFCAFSNSEIGRKAVSWWCNKLQDYCYTDHKLGLFYDQKWTNYFPCIFSEDTYVLREPGYNFAPWNFDERKILNEEGGYYIEDLDGRKSPLYFFHLSGFNPLSKEYIIQKHIIDISVNESLLPVFRSYADLLIALGQEKFSGIAYAFNTYDNGDKITTLHRQLYRALVKDGITYPNLFSTGKGTFHHLLKKSKLLCNEREIIKKDSVVGFEGKARKVNKLLKAAKKVLGIRRYMMLMRYMAYASRFDKQTFLLKAGKNEKIS